MSQNSNLEQKVEMALQGKTNAQKASLWEMAMATQRGRVLELEFVAILVNQLGVGLSLGWLADRFGIPEIAAADPESPIPGQKIAPKRSAVEDVSSAVRAGARVSQVEMRRMLGLPDEVGDTGGLLRFNDQDVLQYHVDSDILTINEIRSTLGFGEVAWGDQTPQARLARLRDEAKARADAAVATVDQGKKRVDEGDLTDSLDAQDSTGVGGDKRA